MGKEIAAGEPSSDGMTVRQRRIADFVTECVRRNGYAPTMREIARASGLASASSVSYQLERLEELGVVARERGRPRTIIPRTRPAARGGGTADVPMVGRIAAGPPILAEQVDVEVHSLPRELVGHGDLIMLTVAGDSMTGAAIADGDWVVVRRGPAADDGDIVAAMLDSDAADGAEATVKTLARRDGHVWLMPHNPDYAPIPGDLATIIGKVVAVLRKV
jgi:repressor LexA